MDERSLIYDWNTVEYDMKRDAANHPHGVWFDDETLRDGLQCPSARNPTIATGLLVLVAIKLSTSVTLLCRLGYMTCFDEMV